jgi:hypothetical protein
LVPTTVDPMHAFEEGIVLYILAAVINPMTNGMKSRLDELALALIKSNKWNSDYPRMNFSGGFSSLTLLTADEKVRKLMLVWLILQTNQGKALLSSRCDP